MSVSTTSVKLAGLVFAMGLFGMGPGTILLEELKATWGKKREDERDEIAASVAPPGEEITGRKSTQPEHNPHLLESIPYGNQSLPRHPTEIVASDAAINYVKHPFLPVKTDPKPQTAAVPWLSFLMRESPSNDQNNK